MSIYSEDFDKLLKSAKVSILEYSPKRTKSVKTGRGLHTPFDLLNKIVGDNHEVYKMAYPKLAPLFDDGSIHDEFHAHVSQKYGSEEDDEVRAAPEDLALLRDCILAKEIQHIEDKVTFFVINSATNKVTNIHPNIFMAVNKINNPEVVARSFTRVYAPRDPLGVYESSLSSGESVMAINTYVPPTWVEYEGEVPDELPKEVRKVFNQVSEEDREFFLHWIYQSITSRANVYLVMQGEPGVGKNVIKSIIRALHGEQNSVDGKKSTLTTQFNSQLQDCTFIQFDEIKYGPDEENVMKEIPNSTISIEAKNKNATRYTEIFCSMILSNNMPRDNYISFDARKFAPIALSDTRLEKAMSNWEIDLLMDKIRSSKSDTFDVAYVAQIGRWIIKHCGRTEKYPQGEYRGRKFWELAHSSMSLWQKLSIDCLSDIKKYDKRNWRRHVAALNEGKLKYSKVKDLLLSGGTDAKIKESHFPRDFSTAKHFLHIFRDLNGNKVYEVEDFGDHITGDFYIKVVEPILVTDEETANLL